MSFCCCCCCFVPDFSLGVGVSVVDVTVFVVTVVLFGCGVIQRMRKVPWKRSVTLFMLKSLHKNVITFN